MDHVEKAEARLFRVVVERAVRVEARFAGVHRNHFEVSFPVGLSRRAWLFAVHDSLKGTSQLSFTKEASKIEQ